MKCLPKRINERAGLLIFGLDYSFIAIEKIKTGYSISRVVCKRADQGKAEETMATTCISEKEIYFRVEVRPENEKEIIPKVLCNFSYSVDGKTFYPLGIEFIAREGKWVGAKVGVFSVKSKENNNAGYADFDWIRFSK